MVRASPARVGVNTSAGHFDGEMPSAGKQWYAADVATECG
jgi:hypothetical protein